MDGDVTQDKKPSAVDVAFAMVVDEVLNDCILDSEIRAVEKIMTKRNKTKGLMSGYKIIKRQKIIKSPTIGFALLYPHGAEIYFCSEGTRVQKMIAVGHELGHIILEHIDAQPHQNSHLTTRHGHTFINPEQEQEASQLAYLFVRRRSRQYLDKEFVKERQHSDEVILAAIKNIHPEYKGLPNSKALKPGIKNK